MKIVQEKNICLDLSARQSSESISGDCGQEYFKCNINFFKRKDKKEWRNPPPQ